MGMALASVSDHRNRLSTQAVQVCVFIVINIQHEDSYVPFSKGDRFIFLAPGPRLGFELPKNKSVPFWVLFFFF
jgi:hypothetical protein